ncbi:MAG: YbaK/EbsC family protein [Hyphomicrobiaceae bacterium]|nr:YbaK/EbsC family protein [Hyphomicrobiaceae bacterium]
MAEGLDANGRVDARARELGLDIAIVEMAQSTRTADEAAAACGCDVGQIVKSLIFRGRESGQPYLLLVSGRNRVNEKGVAKHLGEALRRPDADDVRQLTGFAIGGVPPFGHAEPLKTYIDRDLLAFDKVWAAAGTPRSLFEVAPAALAQATAAEAISVA